MQLLKRCFYCCLLLALSMATHAQETISEIQAEYGQADQIIRKHDGTSYHTYYQKYRSPIYAPDSTRQQVIIAPGGKAIGIPLPQQEIGSTTLILCTTTYKVDAKGRIVSVSKTGNGCT